MRLIGCMSVGVEIQCLHSCLAVVQRKDDDNLLGRGGFLHGPGTDKKVGLGLLRLLSTRIVFRVRVFDSCPKGVWNPFV